MTAPVADRRPGPRHGDGRRRSTACTRYASTWRCRAAGSPTGCIGQRRAVLYGGILIAPATSPSPSPTTAHVLSRPALHRARHRSAQAEHQRHRRPALRQKDVRRDAGFSLFYMGINSARSSARSMCSWLGEPREGVTWVNWHWGFAAAGVGMTFGLVQYVTGQRHLGRRRAERRLGPARGDWRQRGGSSWSASR